MRLSRLLPVVWLCHVAFLLTCLCVPASAQAEQFRRVAIEVAPGIGLPAGVSLPFQESELLNEDAEARLEKSAGSINARSQILLSQGLVGQAINELATELERQAKLGEDDPNLKLALAACYQQTGHFADALDLINTLPDGKRTKHAEYIAALANAKAQVEEATRSLTEDLKEDPKDAHTWAALSRFWLSPSLQVRRNALAAASVAVACNPDYEPAREAMAEALAAYSYTEWSLRKDATSWEWGNRQGLSRPPAELQQKLIDQIGEYAPKLSMVAKLRDLYLIAAQGPATQRDGARLELEHATVVDDPRYEPYLAALRLLAAESSIGTWEDYKALEANRSVYHYFAPLKIAARPVQLALYGLCKPKLDDQMEAIKGIPLIPLPKPDDYVFWEGWHWLAKGIGASRYAMDMLPPETIGNALLQIEMAQQNHEADGQLLGAIGGGWFAAHRAYSQTEYTKKRGEFLVRAVSALDAAAAQGIDVNVGAVRAAALRASGEYDRAQKAVLELADPGLPQNPTRKQKEKTAAEWLRLGLLYLDHRPTVEYQRIACNCFERTIELVRESPFVEFALDCLALAGKGDRSRITSYNNSSMVTLLPPLGAEIYARLCEADTKLAYFELARLADVSVADLNNSSLVSDPTFHARLSLPMLALQMENLVASADGFPIVNGFQYEVERRTNRAFSAQVDFEKAAGNTSAACKRAGLKGVEALALESLLVESRLGLLDTINALHEAMAKGATVKKFAKDHGNTTVSGVLHTKFRIKQPNGGVREPAPIRQANESWENFLFSLTVGYLNWAADRGSISDAFFSLEELKQQVRETSPLRPDRANELTVATKRFDAKMGELMQAQQERLAREEAVREAERQRLAAQQARDAAEEAKRREEWKKHPVVGGLDFSVTEEKRFEYTPPPEAAKEPERITCSVCNGTGVTYARTDWSNAARQSCWRCKGKGWRSPHDM